MVSHLAQSGDIEAACKKACEKSAKQIEQQTDEYLKSGNFGTAPVSGRALSPVRDFKLEQLDPDQPQIAMADLLFANGSAQASKAYTALRGPAPAEGLGLLALKEHKDAEARTLLGSAVESNSESARARLEL